MFKKLSMILMMSSLFVLTGCGGSSSSSDNSLVSTTIPVINSEFRETTANVGTFDNIAYIRFNDYELNPSLNSILTQTSGNVTGNYEIVSSNVPEGLIPVVRLSSVTDNVLEIELTGTANSHNRADSISKITVTLNQNIFNGQTPSQLDFQFSIKFGQLSAPFSARNTHTSIVDTNGHLYVIGGYDGSYQDDVWRSSDQGATWESVASGNRFSARRSHTSIVDTNGNLYVIGGWNGSYQNDVWRSSDQGVTWTQVFIY